MDGLFIQGGIPLSGTLRAQGSKNASLAVLAASLLADGVVRLSRVPYLNDVDTLCHVLAELGMRTERDAEDRLRIETINRLSISASKSHVQRMRASFSVLGPLIARRGHAVVALPGGCNLGPRPIDLHLRGLAALGATIYLSSGLIEVHAKRLQGTRVNMTGPCGPTVTGTMNILSAATLADGVTVIEGAACEPEVQELGRFLVAIGADISGLGTPEITVRGVEMLQAVDFTMSPDRIETATWLAAAMITGGCVTVTDSAPAELTAVLNVLQSMGALVELSSTGDQITITGPRELQPFDVKTAAYPGIPTDVQPLLMALACVAKGKSTLQEQVFPQRFAHVAELRKLGADITNRHGLAEITGVPQLTGEMVTGADLRGTAGLVLAALAAKGETLVRGLGHLQRGYESFAHRLQQLGANVQVVDSRELVQPSPR